MEFCEQVYQAVREHDLIRRGDRVLAAVSGGADSVCLLLVLDKIRQDLQKQGKPSFELALVTVDHGIRGEASAGDVAFADQLGRRLGLPCFVFHEDVPALVRQEHLSEEEAARAVRYRCFAKAARKWQADSVAVAHNKDDQVETVLLNLLRGSGLTGLAGLSWSRTLKTSGPEFGPIVQEPGDCSQECGAGGSPGGEEMDEIRVIRPLLDMSRGEIEAWLSQIGQPFRTDESNLEDHHTRNRLRHHVIPLMEQEINRNAREHIASAASDLAQAAAFAESSAAEWLEKHEALDWFS
ncbi:MAG: tRNA lysidine(34) synthetase TilS, partial [Lachnospiraceae bacterium]|nr:tRNA lysidine(34) synthetase TilS [Lachnospiraceae bacterium]